MAGVDTTTITWWAVVSAFGGTIIGSVLGGLISFCLQKKSLAATRALHDADRKEVRKALGYAMFFKMIRLCSDLQQLGKPVVEAIEQAKPGGHAGELWPRVMPIAPLPDPIKFTPEEMALVLSLDNKLFNDMAALDDLHNSTVAIFRLYGEMRNSLTATLSTVAITGNVGATLLTKEQKERMGPRSVELDMLIQGMVERTQIDGNKAWQCLERLHAVLEKEFDLKHRLELKEGYAPHTEATAMTPSRPQPYYHHYKG
jgi:hypothetical protein